MLTATAEHIMHQANSGLRIIVISDDPPRVRDLLAGVAPGIYFGGHNATTYGTVRARGGGHVYICRTAAACRGRNADYLYLDTGVDERIGWRGIEDARIALQASNHGDVIVT